MCRPLITDSYRLSGRAAIAAVRRRGWLVSSVARSPELNETSAPNLNPVALIAFRCVVLALLLIFVSRTWADPDLWGHVKFGGDILAAGLHGSDPYSFGADRFWINHEWLAEVSMFAAWRAGGDQGLIALKALLTMLVLWIVAGQLSTIPMSLTLRALLLFCVVAGIWARIYVFRPQLFSLLLFAALLALLRAADTGRARLLWLLPAIFALWANLHGGWIVGLATLAVCSVGSLTRRASPGPPKGVIVTVCIASLAATLANPYGSALWSFMTETVRLDRATIADWRPLLEAGPGKILPWAISATFATLAVIHRRPAIAPPYAVLTIGLGLAALRVSRLDAFFSLAVVILLAPQIVSFVEGARRTPSRAGHAPSSWALPALLAGVLAIAAFPREFRCVRLDGPWMPEREAGALIKEAGLQGRLLVWFDWGEYAIWHFEPALKVSFDGRRETVYSADYINRHTTLYFDPARERQALKQLNADHAWLARDLPLVAELERQGWTRLFTGPQSVVLSRLSVSAATPSPIRTPACFPGP